MNAIKIKGIVHQVGGVQKISEKFTKREVVLDITGESKYQTFLCIDFVNDDIKKVDGIGKGIEVEATCYVQSRQGKDGIRWFTSVRGRDITAVAGYTQSVDIPTPATAPDTSDPVIPDDLPF